VFGKVVGGLETLDKMEAVPTGAKDKPKVRGVARIWTRPWSAGGSRRTRARASPRGWAVD